VVCTTVVLLDAFWRPAGRGFLRFLPFLGLCAARIGSMWFVVRLARENVELRKQSFELARKLGML
jgi:hypothetical protein